MQQNHTKNDVSHVRKVTISILTMLSNSSVMFPQSSAKLDDLIS